MDIFLFEIFNYFVQLFLSVYFKVFCAQSPILDYKMRVACIPNKLNCSINNIVKNTFEM